MGVALIGGWVFTSVAQTAGGRSALSIITAYGSMLLIVVTVVIRPWATWRGRKTPTSVDLRRDAGLSAAVLGAVHVVASLGNHLGGVVRLYFFVGGRPRHDTFGLMTWTGVLATLILALLAITSNDASLRRLRKRWKQVQRSVHALIVVALVHTLLAAHLLDRPAALLVMIVMAVGAVYALRSIGRQITTATPPRASV